MHTNIDDFYITEKELKEAIGLSHGDIWAHKAVKTKRLSIFLIPILLLSGGLEMGYAYYLIKWNIFRKNQNSILEEVDKYNATIKAIDIHEQLVAAGNTNLALNNRETILATLETTRSNLMRALLTERILRKNRTFIAHNKKLIATNLTALQTLPEHLQAQEYSQALNEALQIAQQVQAEMKKLP
jgi:hypothetical protein